MSGGPRHSPAHTWISVRLVLETLLLYFVLCAASAGAMQLAGWPRLLIWPPLLLALGLWLDRMYAVGHEAVHRKLFPDRPALNDLVGALLLTPICAPLTVFRKIHKFHHGQNRRAPRVATLDVIILPPGPPWRRRLARGWGWTTWLLAVFAGGFFLHSLVSVVLFLLLPTALACRISPAFKGWRARDRVRSWLELLVGVGLHLLVWRLGDGSLWLATLGLPLLAFAWVWSLLLYIYHYRTTIGGDIRYNVRSLRSSGVMSWLLLNFNEHTTHHADPRIPWYQLPQRRIAPPPSHAANHNVSTLAAAILQQLRGPMFVERPVGVAVNAGLHLRRAVAADLDALVAIKLRLRMRVDPHDAGQSSRGGFLLGASRAQYARLIAGGHTWVLGDGEQVVGFAAALPDAELRASELWQRRGELGLGEDLRALEELPIGYLDQLALLPDPKYRIAGVALAYHAVADLFAAGCAFVVTTVVDRPVRNLASRPLLAAVGALQLGSIEEHHEDVGAITSDVFMVPRAALDLETQTDLHVQAQLRRLHSLARKLKVGD